MAAVENLTESGISSVLQSSSRNELASTTQQQQPNEMVKSESTQLSRSRRDEPNVNEVVAQSKEKRTPLSDAIAAQGRTPDLRSFAMSTQADKSKHVQLFVEEAQRSSYYPREIFKTIGVLFMAIIALLANTMVISIVTDITGRNPLPDLVFSLIPIQIWAFKAADYMLIVTIFIPMIFCVIFHKHSSLVFRRWSFHLAVLYGFRAVCLSSTTLPSPFPGCAPPKNISAATVMKRWITQTIHFGIQEDKGLLCGDYMYSGHTIQYCISWFIMSHYSHRSLWPFRCIVIIAAILGMIFLAISHAHYTLDVIVAYALCTGLFSMYHAICDLPHNVRPMSGLRRLLFFWFIYDLEKNIPHGPVPKQMSWPLPWPQRCIKMINNWSDCNTNTKCGRISANLASLDPISDQTVVLF